MKRRVLGGAILFALLVAALVLLRRGSEPEGAKAAHSAAPAAPAMARPSMAPSRMFPFGSDEFSPESLRRMLDDYKRVAAYPHWSRPHDPGTAYLLAWNQPEVSTLPMSDDPDHPLSYRYGADRAHVMFGEALTSWIEVFDAADESQRVPATVISAWVLSTTSGRKVRLEYHDDGRDGDDVAGDHRYTNRFVPSQYAELAQAEQVVLRAHVAAGGVEKILLRDFTYTPRPVLELLAISDGPRDGSLVVGLDVQVYQSGLYTFEANVSSGDGQTPIAFADTSMRLEAGRRRAELTFFGKAFHDKGKDGPYRVTDLRGFLRMTDGRENNLWWSDPRTYTTGPWTVRDFAAAPWDSPEKRETIGRFEQLITAATAHR